MLEKSKKILSDLQTNEYNMTDIIVSDDRRMILDVFICDARSKLVEIPQCLESGNNKVFKIHIHAMKSAAANVGEMKLTGLAGLLEEAAKNGNDDYINENINDFIIELQNVIDKHELQVASHEDDIDVSTETLHKLKISLEEIDIGTIDQIMAEVRSNRSMSDIAKLVLIGDYNKAIKAIMKYGERDREHE
ncbi:MAG: hypothetical protein LBD23_12665 [Oscillospiraceae bacterium]|jgi:HPt (histidine-containing phosphotransfer) domain-containing protein|nr:hypothetical protein [Oscillospiraceae bacterium]